MQERLQAQDYVAEITCKNNVDTQIGADEQMLPKEAEQAERMWKLVSRGLNTHLLPAISICSLVCIISSTQYLLCLMFSGCLSDF